MKNICLLLCICQCLCSASADSDEWYGRIMSLHVSPSDSAGCMADMLERHRLQEKSVSLVRYGKQNFVSEIRLFLFWICILQPFLKVLASQDEEQSESFSKDATEPLSKCAQKTLTI